MHHRAPRPSLRRSARDARPAPAARRHARARARSQCGRPVRRGHRRWPRGSCLAARTHWRAMPNAPGSGVGHACSACLPRATGSIFGMNSGETQRAVELAAADPANRARLGPRRELGERRRPKELPRRAAFEHEPERAAARGLSGARTRDDPVRCTAARRRSKGNTPAAQHPSTQHPVFNTLMSPFSFFCLRAPPTSVRTSHPQTSDSGLSATSGARQFHPLHISQSPHSDTHAAQTLTPHLIGARAQGVKYRDAGEGSRCCGLRSQRPKLSEERSRSRPGAPACASA